MSEDRVKRPHVVVVGSTMVDLIAYADVLPGPGQTLEGREFHMGFGGKGANQAVMAARLGATVTFVNRVGADFFGRITRENLSERNIDPSRVRAVEGLSTGVAPIWVEPEGTNRIIIVPGANQAVTPEVVRAELDGIEGADCVVCQLEIPQESIAEAFRFGRRWDAVTILNPAPAAPLEDDVVELADWIVPNETEFQTLVGETADETAILRASNELGARLIVTLGEHGAAFARDGQVFRIPAPTAEAVDTTGAGDAFVGGLAYALAAGQEVQHAIAFGNACGALSVTKPGTQSSFPDSQTVLAAVEGLSL